MQPLEANDPTVIGPYRLLGRLGGGGMGRVYLGRSPGGRTVAVKVVRSELADDPEFRTRFRREVDAARRVDESTNMLCAPVLDADTDSPVPWIATGYVAGPTLSDAVSEFGPLPVNGVRALGAGLAEALVALHGMGLIHRDIKPSNVLLALDGPVLIDFGIARAMEATTSFMSKGVVVGSPGYMAPEQITGGRTGPEADVFSLGAVLAYACAGHGPFTGDSTAVLLYKVAHEEPELDGLPEELRDVAEACLAKDPDLRPGPREIAERLAPDGGSAALVRHGWLPASLMEQLGRHAVELLDLEAAPPDPLLPSAPPASSVSSVSLSVPYGSVYGDPGAFGPPAPYPAQPLSYGVVAAGAVRPGRRRALVATAVALAVLAAAVAGWVLWRPHVGTSASGSVGDGKPTTITDGGAVPDAFLGTWKGTVFQRDGTPNGSMTVTITRGAKGADVVRATYSVYGLECHSRARLVTATATRLTVTERGTGGGASPLCTGNPATVTLTFAAGWDGPLIYRSDDTGGGTPHARLTRTGG